MGHLFGSHSRLFATEVTAQPEAGVFARASFLDGLPLHAERCTGNEFANPSIVNIEGPHKLSRELSTPAFRLEPQCR